VKNLLINDSVFQSVIVYGLLLAGLVVLLLKRAAISHFLREVRTELGKCTWPWDPEHTGLRKYKQLIDSSVVVIVTTLLVAGYVTCFDFLIGNLIAWMINF
jgi:preprotein translocase subunit SecE